MPIEPDLPDELPAELIAVESLLQQFVPVESVIDREVTLYEAGWAAAESRLPKKSHWLWPTTSGVLAASLLLLIAFPLTSPLQRGESERPISIQQAHKRRSPSPLSPSQLTPSQPAHAPSKPPRSLTPLPRRPFSPAPFLAMRERALHMEFNEPTSFVGMDDDLPTKTFTVRELMQELLGENS